MVIEVSSHRIKEVIAWFNEQGYQTVTYFDNLECYAGDGWRADKKWYQSVVYQCYEISIFNEELLTMFLLRWLNE